MRALPTKFPSSMFSGWCLESLPRLMRMGRIVVFSFDGGNSGLPLKLIRVFAGLEQRLGNPHHMSQLDFTNPATVIYNLVY